MFKYKYSLIIIAIIKLQDDGRGTIHVRSPGAQMPGGTNIETFCALGYFTPGVPGVVTPGCFCVCGNFFPRGTPGCTLYKLYHCFVFWRNYVWQHLSDSMLGLLLVLVPFFFGTTWSFVLLHRSEEVTCRPRRLRRGPRMLVARVHVRRFGGVPNSIVHGNTWAKTVVAWFWYNGCCSLHFGRKILHTCAGTAVDDCVRGYSTLDLPY